MYHSGRFFLQVSSLFFIFLKFVFDLFTEVKPPIDQVIEARVVPRIIECLSVSEHSQLQYEALWCLTNIASGTHANTEYLINLNVIQIFLNLLGSDNPKIKEQACWAIGNIAGDCSEFRDIVLQHDGMTKVLELFNGEKKKVALVRVATWTMSNLCRGKPQPQFSIVCYSYYFLHTQRIYDDDFLTIKDID